MPRFLATLVVSCAPFLSVLISAQPAAAQSLPPALYSGLQWRLIGPFRAGRVVAVSGVPGSHREFFFGGVDGGVWKTTDAGTVWQPTFDHAPVASIGSIAVADSDPRIVYAGTGESDIRSDLASGDGIYRSDDGGSTWKHVGLTDSQQISRILVDPANASTVYVGVLGHAYGPSDERGVYKSTDAGQHWQRVLDKGPNVGIADIAMARAKPNILFAATWNAHRPPWSTYPPVEGPGNALYRTTDGGATWTQIAGDGLPHGNWGRTGIAISPDGTRVYATIVCPGHSGLYRSDDGGDSWTLMNTDRRLTSRAWYFSSLAIDPSNPDVLYIPNVALYRTNDGGKKIEIVRGAPGGDDYHQIWVDPRNSDDLMLGVDQGASVSLDRGKTWTTWYNQPTAQMYHVTTDDKFPYYVYGAQQDSGSIAIASRSDHGHIDTRDWFLPGGSESGYLAIDPRDENIIYASDTYGDVERFDRRTSFGQTITPWPLGGFYKAANKRKYRDPWTPVLVFSPADKRSLYLGTQYVLKTTDGGLHWQQISPDLTGAVAGASEAGELTTENSEQRGYGVVFTIAPSPLKGEEIWAGSDTGRVHLTTDSGRTWQDVTPPGLSPWSKISLIEASHFDPATAYAAVDRHRLGDRKPYLYITHDYGKSWKLSVDGIAPTHFVRAVREDPKQRDLLFAGTEFGMYVSFDAGEHWQSLQQNLPVSSVRDMTIHGSDLIVATHGRSFWILDDIAPLRQAAAVNATKAYLYGPPIAVRVDNDAFLGTPLPPEEPQANNPPEGAIVDYYLGSNAGKVTLQVLDGNGRILRHFSSADKPTIKRPLLPIAERWFPAPHTLKTGSGEHRFIWDLSYGGSGTDVEGQDIDAASIPPGPRVPPGTYTIRLSVDGVSMERTVQVTMDPRSPATTAVLDQQFALGGSIYLETLASRKAMAELESVETQLNQLRSKKNNPADLQKELLSALTKLESIKNGEGDQSSSPEKKIGLADANTGLGVALRVVESGDRPAPAQAIVIFDQMKSAANTQIAAWQHFKASDLAGVNAALQRAHQPSLQISAIEEEVHYAMTR
ncbi:MAG TPA: hypothetical protein VE195_08825 [Acidobacteriaceae bacterium]|nr:hypothetical protein [Acidobacteriaceae bacterium]